MELQDIIQIQQFVNNSNERCKNIKDIKYEETKTRIFGNEIEIYKEEDAIYESDITPIILYALSKNIHFLFENHNGEKILRLF